MNLIRLLVMACIFVPVWGRFWLHDDANHGRVGWEVLILHFVVN